MFRLTSKRSRSLQRARIFASSCKNRDRRQISRRASPDSQLQEFERLGAVAHALLTEVHAQKTGNQFEPWMAK